MYKGRTPLMIQKEAKMSTNSVILQPHVPVIPRLQTAEQDRIPMIEHVQCNTVLTTDPLCNTHEMEYPIHILIVCGARPNIPKVWTIVRGLKLLTAECPAHVTVTTVHSGQHYHEWMGEGFANDLGVHIDMNLDVGSGASDADQIAVLISRINIALDSLQPDCVVVVGDVNTTLAAALVSARRGLPVVHIEAGLRSNIWEPEELNRKIITSCSNYHLAPSELAANNLLNEGVQANTIFVVGNTMAETFLCHADSRYQSQILQKLSLSPRGYILFTAHKPATLTRPEHLVRLLMAITRTNQVVFPCHPRTLKLLLEQFAHRDALQNLVILDPLPYDDFGSLLENSYCTITDSDGVQEECTVANIPCITITSATARPETVMCGSNHVIGFDIDQCLHLLLNLQASGIRPKYWDTQVSQRIKASFRQIFQEVQRLRREMKWEIRHKEKEQALGQS